MLPKDLTKDIKDRLKTVSGQIGGVINLLDDEGDPDQILIQFKSQKKNFRKQE